MEAGAAKPKASTKEAASSKDRAPRNVQTPSEAENLEGKSRQAQFSSYSENTDLPDENPPLGSHVVQELGEPAEGDVGTFKGIDS